MKWRCSAFFLPHKLVQSGYQANLNALDSTIETTKNTYSICCERVAQNARLINEKKQKKTQIEREVQQYTAQAAKLTSLEAEAELQVHVLFM